TFTITPVKQFAFLKNESRVLKFASDYVNKTALCIQGFQTTESSKSSFLTDVVSTTEESISKEFTVGVGIGVAVGILCIVGAVIVVIVLIRRGVLPCTFGTPTDEPYASTISFANRSNEETLPCHKHISKTEEDLGLTLVEPRKKYQQLMNRCLRYQQAAVYQKDMT
ncbi:hypothetical protein DPMN_078393, partial [Dreissena polymorpha]